MRIRTLTILGMAALLAPSLSGGQELRFGQDGNVTWEGAVSGLQDVSTSAPEYVPALDPTTTEVGIAPGGRIELDHPDHSEALLPLQLAHMDSALRIAWHGARHDSIGCRHRRRRQY